MRWAVLLMFGCASTDEPANDGVSRTTTDTLPLPDLSQIPIDEGFQEAMSLLLDVHAKRPWEGHRTTLDESDAGCPDIYLGRLEEPSIDDGTTWLDSCEATSGKRFEGFLNWVTDVYADGDPATAIGRSTDASRVLQGDALVRETYTGTRFALDGRVEDSLSLLEAMGESVSWTWTTLVDARMSGSAVFDEDASFPNGWRSDLYLSAHGGDYESVAFRGNLYLYDQRIQQVFDSIDVDLAMVEPSAMGPDDCALEPRGRLSLRDPDAIWYDLIFMPGYEEDLDGTSYPNEPLSVCDGCGTLYVRGVESGTVCPDFGVWFGGAIEPPAIEDFVMLLQGLP